MFLIVGETCTANTLPQALIEYQMRLTTYSPSYEKTDQSESICKLYNVLHCWSKQAAK